jgi:hypothetical protein
MDKKNISEEADIIFNELQDLLYFTQDRMKCIIKYNELSLELKKHILVKTTDKGDSLLLLACDYKLSELAKNIINDCIYLGIENILNKVNYAGITPLIKCIQQKLYDISLILLNSNYSNPNHKTENNSLAIDFVIDNIEGKPEIFFESKSKREIFSLLINNYIDNEYDKD